MTTPCADQQPLKDEIADLERRLQDAKARLEQRDVVPPTPAVANDAGA